MGEIIIQILLEGLLYLLVYPIRWLGALVFSICSLWNESPLEHYKTDSFDKKVAMFWTGFITLGILIFLVYKIISIAK